MADRKVTTSLLRSITFSLAASLLLMAQASTARADHASCMEKAKSYFAEIDQLLSKEKIGSCLSSNSMSDTLLLRIVTRTSCYRKPPDRGLSSQ
jgi:hypothetical protein